MKKKNISEKIIDNDWFWVIVIFIVCFVSYFLLVQAWRITSPNYPPANALDLKIRLPENREDWLVRRANGVCPFDAADFDWKDPFAGFRNC